MYVIFFLRNHINKMLQTFYSQFDEKSFRFRSMYIYIFPFDIPMNSNGRVQFFFQT